MEISPEETLDGWFLWQDPVRCKILLDKKCLQQVRNFKYFGFEISCENEQHIQKQKH